MGSFQTQSCSENCCGGLHSSENTLELPSEHNMENLNHEEHRAAHISTDAQRKRDIRASVEDGLNEVLKRVSRYSYKKGIVYGTDKSTTLNMKTSELFQSIKNLISKDYPEIFEKLLKPDTNLEW